MRTLRSALARRRRRTGSRDDPDLLSDGGLQMVRLTQLYVHLPYHWARNGESLWGRRLGGDRYELHTVPLCAYGLNLADVVEATAEAPEVVPEIRRVLIHSGHRTLRLFFVDSLPECKRLALLRRLNRLAVAFERGSENWFALDVAPGVDIKKVLKTLDRWRLRGWSAYETCEARVAGSFDDRPDEHTH
jgi:hypothetical protein